MLTLNEISGLKVLLDRLPLAEVDECFAVDGGSTDGTVEFLARRGISVVGQSRRGRGQAFQIGVATAQGEHLVFFSPDGNEDPNDIVRLFAKLEEGYDMAIASRFLPGSRNEEDDKRLPLRAWANRAFTWIANRLWNRGPYVTDTINGYRGVTKAAFEGMGIDADGFVVEYQMSIRAMKQRMRVVELPTQESDRIGGMSTAKSLPTGIVFLKFLWRELRMGNGG
ncbi:MAG: glycosyltransferase family 2 protein [Candidatus Omnitrophica bacterium]|nr:glycosyltransferase family 2 protein [Candidatus Omnitrophota bacterium]